MKTARGSETVQFREFDPGSERDAVAFRELNEEWITRHFIVEDQDRKVLGDPLGQIIRPGGAILFAELEGRTVGCCALLAQAADPHTYELAKLAVTPEFQGRQIGRQLMLAVIAKARAMGAQRLFLLTNSSLKPARKLYESLNFTCVTPAQACGHAHYNRCDTFMELRLE
jgi:GNAT superfamily N-acetyltransferase